jgi:adiponectin receptor
MLRLSTFVATGFSSFAPIFHGVLLFGHRQLDQQTGLRYYYLEGILILIGVGFYAVRL